MRKRDKAIEKTETPNELPTSFFQVFFLLGIFTTWLCITADSCLEKQHNKNDDGNKNQAPRNMDEKRRIESRCETIVISLHPTFYTHTHKPTCIWVHLILHAAFLVSKEIQHISLTCTHTHTSNELRIEKQNKNLEFSSKHLYTQDSKWLAKYQLRTQTDQSTYNLRLYILVSADDRRWEKVTCW